MSTCPTHLSEFSYVCAVMSRAFQLQMKWPERKSAVSLEPSLGRELSFRIEHFLEIHDTPTSFEAEEGHWAISCAVQFRTETWNACRVYNDTADRRMKRRLRLRPPKAKTEILGNMKTCAAAVVSICKESKVLRQVRSNQSGETHELLPKQHCLSTPS